MYKIILAASLAVVFVSCKNNSESNEGKQVEGVTKPEPFYPFPQYLKEQVAYVDSMPLAVQMVVAVDGKTVDSGFIKKDDFKNRVTPFFAIDPNDEKWKEKYEENSFQDLTLNTITFSISTKDPDIELQQADVLLNPENKKVKDVMLKRNIVNADSSIMQNVLWVHNMKCQVSESISTSKGHNYTKVTNYIWDRPIN